LDPNSLTWEAGMNCLQFSCLRNLLLLTLLSALGFPQTETSTKPSPPGPNRLPPPQIDSNLKLEGDLTLTLDPVCSACQGAFLNLKLRNDGAEPVPVSFSHGTIASTPVKPFPATVEIFPLDSTALTAKPDPTVTSLKPHSTTPIRVKITGVLGEGEWTVPLQNQGKDFASIKVANPKPDFTVKLDSPTPDNPEMTFERGKPATLTLRNDSDTPYSVVASYVVNSRPASLLSLQTCESAPGPVIPAPDKPCIVKLPAHSAVPLTVKPLEDWFALPSSPALQWTWRIHPLRWSARWAAWALSRVGVLLKDQTAEGRLQVQMASPACSQDPGAPILSFKVNTHLAAFSKDSQGLGGNAIMFLVLLLGGTFSLVLNFLLPMQARRRNLKASLQQAGRKITDLSLELDSRVRVSVGVERQRLGQRIKALSLLSTQYGPDVTDVEQSLDRLMKRLDLLDQMQLSLAGYSRAQQRDLPATLVRQIEAIRKQALDLLQKSDPTDADLQKVLGLIQEIEHRLMGFGQADAAFAKLLFDEVTRRRKERVTNPPTGPLVFLWNAVPGFPEGFFAGFADLSNSLAQELASAPPDLEHMQPEDYAPLDALRNRLIFLEKYQKILNGHPTLAPGFNHCSERLLAELRNITWDSLADADRLIREMQERVFPEDIIDHVTHDHVRIKVDRIYVRQFEPATFSLEFDIDDLKDAAACEEFTYRWHFDDTFTEDGWTVSHYFQKPTIVEPLGLFKLLKRKIRYRWQRLLFRLQTGNWGPPPDEIHDPYNVRATLIANYDGATVPHEIPMRDGPLKVEPPFPPTGHALLAELFRLLLALGLAVLGLVAGAKDQILKLDVVPALIAIFLLGVGADQIKNLLTQQPAGK
jgi:hypothetical protein